jgi:hypothetical protein
MVLKAVLQQCSPLGPGPQYFWQLQLSFQLQLLQQPIQASSPESNCLLRQQLPHQAC